MTGPAPYDGGICTRRNHVVTKNDEGELLLIETTDDRLYRCDCGCMMIANGHAEIRFGLLPFRFPESAQGAGDERDPACVKAWPECESGAYDPRCCRFPKSCSCTVAQGARE